jgi:prepilin-type N-terminal cleavage/methylation domain-containing protein
MATKQRGFTLIELSIVLVIIGLVIGGVIVGRDMIKASEMRALLSQKDSFTIALQSFKNKYNFLPGDVTYQTAAKFGLFQYGGLGAYANDEMIQSLSSIEGGCYYECAIFWRHLADSGFISGTYDNGPALAGGSSGTPTGENSDTPLTASKYMPKTKGPDAYWGTTGFWLQADMYFPGYNDFFGRNAFFLTGAFKAAGYSQTEPSLTPFQLKNIDDKADDGKPNSGKIRNTPYEWNNYSDFIYWSASPTANSIICTTGGATADAADVRYNANPSTGGNSISCQPIFVW